MGIAVNLPLINQATLAGVHKLHRIFDGQNMLEALFVDVVDHRRQGRAFPRPRGPGHQH